MSDAAVPTGNPPRGMDLKVSLAVLLTLALEAAGAMLWVGSAAQRISALETSIAAQAPVNERLARLEAEMAAARASLTRIESRLDRRGETP
jgi:Tfp pilus assembly protein PilX